MACSTDTSSLHLTSQVSVMTETGLADLPPLIAIGNRCDESPFVLYGRVCTLASPSFSPLVSSRNFTLSLRSIIEVRMATRNGPDLVRDHCSSIENSFASISSTVQFARAAFVAGVGVKVSVAVLDGAVVVRAVDSLFGCRMVVACLANKCFLCLRAFFAAFFEISAIVEIHENETRDDAVIP